MSRRSPAVRGWSDGAMVLVKLSVPRRPTNLDNGRARAYCACSRCGLGLFGHFKVRLSFLLSFSLFRRLKCLKGPLNPKKPNKPNPVVSGMRTPVYGCHHIYSKVSDKNCVSKCRQ